MLSANAKHAQPVVIADDEDEASGANVNVVGTSVPMEKLLDTLNKVFQALLQVANGQAEMLTHLRTLNAKLAGSAIPSHTAPVTTSSNKAISAVDKLQVHYIFYPVLMTQPLF